MNLKIDQLAFFCDDLEEQKELAKNYNIDSEDRVTAVGINREGELIRNVATLMFDHTNMPLEFEFLCYTSGLNWINIVTRSREPHARLSHVGMHVENLEEIEAWRARCDVLQEVVTIHHTNPGMGDRRYHYVILDTMEGMGTCLKLIRRIDLLEQARMLAEQEQRGR